MLLKEFFEKVYFEKVKHEKLPIMHIAKVESSVIWDRYNGFSCDSNHIVIFYFVACI